MNSRPNLHESYRTAIKLAPNNKEALNGLGKVLRLQGRSEDSIKVFRKVVEIDPSHEEAYRSLGNKYQSEPILSTLDGIYAIASRHQTPFKIG